MLLSMVCNGNMIIIEMYHFFLLRLAIIGKPLFCRQIHRFQDAGKIFLPDPAAEQAGFSQRKFSTRILLDSRAGKDFKNCSLINRICAHAHERHDLKYTHIRLRPPMHDRPIPAQTAGRIYVQADAHIWRSAYVGAYAYMHKLIPFSGSGFSSPRFFKFPFLEFQRK